MLTTHQPGPWAWRVEGGGGSGQWGRRRAAGVSRRGVLTNMGVAVDSRVGRAEGGREGS